MNTLKKLWQEEDGMEALQVVLIIAVAALVLAFVYKTFGETNNSDGATAANTHDETVVGWFNVRIQNLLDWK